MQNLLIGPNGLSARVAANLADIFTATNCTIVYEAWGQYKSWVPGRDINAFTALVEGRGYIVVAKQAINVSTWFGTYAEGLLNGTGGGGTGPAGPAPVVTLDKYAAVLPIGGTTTFNATADITGSVFNWYETLLGVTPVFSGPAFTTPAMTGRMTYYLEGVSPTGVKSSRVVVNLSEPVYSGSVPLFNANLQANNSLAAYTHTPGDDLSPQIIQNTDGFDRIQIATDPVYQAADAAFGNAVRKTMFMSVGVNDNAGITENARAQVQTPMQYTEGMDVWVAFSVCWQATFWTYFETLAELYAAPYAGTSAFRISIQAANIVGSITKNDQTQVNIFSIPMEAKKWYDFKYRQKLSKDGNIGEIQVFLRKQGEVRYSEIVPTTKEVTINTAMAGTTPAYHKIACYYDFDNTYTDATKATQVTAVQQWMTGHKVGGASYLVEMPYMTSPQGTFQDAPAYVAPVYVPPVPSTPTGDAPKIFNANLEVNNTPQLAYPTPAGGDITNVHVTWNNPGASGDPTIMIVDDPLAKKGKVMKFNAALADTAGVNANPRAQVQTPAWYVSGQRVFAGFSIMWPQDFWTQFLTFAEFYGPPYSGNSTFRLGVQQNFITAIWDNTNKWQSSNLPFVKNQWYDFVVADFLSADATVGEVCVWMRKQGETTWTNVVKMLHAQTIGSAMATGPYFHKIGLYYDVANTYTSTAKTTKVSNLVQYMANHKVGDTFQIVEPALVP